MRPHLPRILIGIALVILILVGMRTLRGTPSFPASEPSPADTTTSTSATMASTTPLGPGTYRGAAYGTAFGFSYPAGVLVRTTDLEKGAQHVEVVPPDAGNPPAGYASLEILISTSTLETACADNTTGIGVATLDGLQGPRCRYETPGGSGYYFDIARNGITYGFTCHAEPDVNDAFCTSILKSFSF